MENTSSFIAGLGSMSGVIQINFRELEKFSIERYQRCPKYITIVRHANLEDDSEFHCILMDYIGPKPQSWLQRNFIVPEQKVLMANDATFGLFAIIRVYEKEDGPEFALIASVQTVGGIIISIEDLQKEVFHIEEPEELTS